MIELEWKRVNPTTEVCNYDKYFLKRKTIGGRTWHEIWKGELLQYNNLTYWDLLKHITGKVAINQNRMGANSFGA